MFAETITQSAARFADVYFFAQSTGNTVDEIGGNAREMISYGNSSLGSGDFVRVGNERTSPTFECAELMIRFQCTFN